SFSTSDGSSPRASRHWCDRTRACSRPTWAAVPQTPRWPRQRRRPWKMLAVESLITDYGPVRAVNDVSLRVPDGTITAVLGANGAGKTSLLRTITGLVRPTAGR